MSDSSRFGRYEVEEEVARGGMGVIYRVRDPQMRRFLAMKVLLSEGEDGQAGSGSRHSKLAARFTDEAQLTGQLDHPGIIPVYDMGQDEEGRLFFTMRLVKGRTFQEIIALARAGRGGWTVTRALGVLQKVCEAMGFAHDRGVIHRDLKPANVMVGRFGETYVMDWGLAKLVDGDGVPRPAEESTLQTVLTSARKDESSGSGELETVAGDVMGTPAYMSPEQARGEIHRVGPRSDVYSLGAMLYHLLTGHPPYRPAGESTPAQEVLERLLSGPPDPVEGEAAAVPPELCAICDRAMAREPEERYAGMLEMAEDLQAYLENRVVQAYRRGAVIEFRKWVQRNRAIAASLAAVFVLVIAGLAAVSYVQTRARNEVERTNTTLEATNTELEAERERTADALERAERNRERAVANEEEALWQSYVGNVGAAYAALEVGSASEARRRLAACPEASRGWEWRYLDQRSDASLRVLTGSETFVTTLAVDPVRTQVAAAGGMSGDSGAPDYTVRIWDFESGELVRELEGNETNVTGLAYSPGGDLLVSSDRTGKLHLWDVESGELVAEPSGLGSRIAFHPEGRLIATAYYSGGRVVLWDSYDMVEVASRDLPAGTNAVRFSPDGQSLALAGRDHHVRVLDLDLEQLLDLDASHEVLAANHSRNPGVSALDYSPDSRYLVTGSSDGFVRTWDLETGARLLLLSGHQTSVLAVCWHPRLPWIVSSDETGSVRFWDAVTGRALDVLRGHDEDVHALGFSPLGDRLLSASRDKTVRVWDGQAGVNDTLLEGLAYPNFQPFRLSFSPEGERIVWRSGSNALTVTDVSTGEDLCSRWTYDPFVTRALGFAQDGIWSCESSGRLARWDAETGEQLSAWETKLGVVACAFRRDERTALLAGVPLEGLPASRRLALQLVDLASGKARWTTSLSMFPGNWISVSPDGTRCLVAGRALEREDWGLACFETTSGTLLWEVWGLPGVHGMQFFPDGARLAQTTYNGWDNTVFLRDGETGEVLERLVGHAQPASLDISPDGSRIVTGNWDGTLSLWSPERGEILALPAHVGYTTNVRFSPDGQTIASLGEGGLRRLWSATPVESRQAARRAAARRRRWAVDARRRVDELMVSRVHSAAVVEALEADPDLLPEQRAAAILLARSEASQLVEVVQRSLAISLDPGRPGAEYMAALEGAKAAAARVPGPAIPLPAGVYTEVAKVHMAVGAAQLRLGLPREALSSLDLAEETYARGSTSVLPAIEFLKSMAHHGLGDAQAAGAAFERGQSEASRRDAAVPPELATIGGVLELEARELLGRD